MAVSTSVSVAAAPARVWALMNDPARRAEWVSNHAGFVGEAPVAYVEAGEYSERIRVMGMPTDVAWRVDRVVPGSAVVFSGRGPMGILIRSELTVEAEGEGSRVTIAQGFSGPAVMAVKAQLEKEIKAAQEVSLNTVVMLFAG